MPYLIQSFLPGWCIGPLNRASNLFTAKTRPGLLCCCFYCNPKNDPEECHSIVIVIVVVAVAVVIIIIIMTITITITIIIGWSGMPPNFFTLNLGPLPFVFPFSSLEFAQGWLVYPVRH